MFKTVATAGLLLAAFLSTPALAQERVLGLLICGPSRTGLTVTSFDSPLAINIGIGEACTAATEKIMSAAEQAGVIMDIDTPIPLANRRGSSDFLIMFKEVPDRGIPNF